MPDPNFTSNFTFLDKDYPFLANLARSAEYHLYTDAPVSISKLRLFGEKITEVLFFEFNLQTPHDTTLSNRLRVLKREGVLKDHKILNCFYQIKERGNKAVHDAAGTTDEAASCLYQSFLIGKWMIELFDGKRPEQKFSKPPNLDTRHALHLLKNEYSELEEKYQAQLETIKTLSAQRSKEEEEKLKTKAFELSAQINLTEEQTREIIDKQLRDAGWEVDTKDLTYKKGTRPEKGKNKAISEWKTNGGWIDYALFIGEEAYGVIEAKKKQRDVLSDMKQAKRYATDADEKYGGKFLGNWGKYHIPFMFTTNSTGYHYMMENRSGTWFLDGRKSTNHPQPLKNWFSPRDLQELYKKNVDQALVDLENDPYEYLKNPKGLSLRYYQIEAVQAVEHAVSIPTNDKALLAMATGTGKTRTVLGICYRLLKSKRFKRILFLVDRTLLGTQAADSFKDVKVEGYTFAESYDIKELKEITPELDTKVHFSTVQGMYRRIFDNANDKNVPTVGTYDCIIIDEAHRGYNLDLQMDEEEIYFKDQSDYRSKYRQVIEYFNAFMIGMTATPAPHTISIFGRPVYEYAYNKAVVDGFLVGYEPPYLIRTELSGSGIQWKQGENVKVYNRLTREIEELENVEDEINVEVGGFNKQVITEAFNRTVLRELTKFISPFGQEKTLIFAASDDHATDVVKWLKETYLESGIEVDDDAIQKITGSVDRPSTAVKLYKNERNPVIVVTVDLLTTGVDVPEICNLVFLRRVNSRILYEQMKGRATRLCDDIGKESFRIFDAVGLYKSLEDFTNMKPVVTSPKANFEDLVKELDMIEGLRTEVKELAQQKQIEQIITKLHRKKKRISGEQEEQFKILSGGVTPDEFIQQIRNKEKVEATNFIREKKKLFQFLDEMKGVPQRMLYSEHEDAILPTVRDYDVTYDANDYLQKFREYITENRNKLTALELVCTRPKSLSRQDLKALKVELSLAGYDTTKLQTAWKNSKNEDIAADIIAYIRTLALGSPLVSQEERIQRAMKKVKAIKPWTKSQEIWLQKIENQLIKESILHKEDLDKGIFKNEIGGFKNLNKIFEDELEQVLEVINDNLYGEAG